MEHRRENPREYTSLAEAYRGSIRAVLENGTQTPGVTDSFSVGSGFGASPRPTIELLGFGIRISDPLSCLFLSPSRVVNLPYCYQSFLWTVSGSDQLAPIAFYNRRGELFSDDGQHLAGAFGKRLFRKPSQVDAAIEKLRRDPSTRRAIASIVLPSDHQQDTRDFPCAVAVQYLIRNDLLHAITFMRSQSALMVFPYDAFLFMSLQALVAARLEVGLGSYVHLSGSFHVYEDERVLAETTLEQDLGPVSVSPMKNASLMLTRTLDFEGRVRRAATNRDFEQIRRLVRQQRKATDFFTEANVILLMETSRRVGLGDEASECSGLLPGHLGDVATSYLMSRR